MRKIVFSLAVIALVVTSQSFTAKSAYQNPKDPALSYAKDIVPIMQASCTPCHFPPDGRKEPLDSYEAVKKNIGEVIARVKLPHDDRKFMPFREKKPALNDSLIKVLETWQAQNMPE